MTALDIATMPVAEKLKLMEALWDSLSAGPEEKFASPEWHRAELDARLSRLASGAETTASWPEAKERLRAQIKSA